jgi:hypothetical protein
MKDAKMSCQQLIVLRFLVVVGLLLIIIIIGSTCGADAKSSQLSRSQRGIGVRDGQVDRHVRELKERLIPLTVDNLLVVPNYLKALLHHIHVLIHAMAHGKDTLEHLQEARVGTRGGGSTTTLGSARRSNNWRSRCCVVSPWILGHCGAKRLMCYILVKLLMCHHLNHAMNVGSKSTRSQWVGGNVSYLIHYVLKHIKPYRLRESIK